MSPYPTRRAELRRCLDTALSTTLQNTCKKYNNLFAKPNRLKYRKDAVVWGKQVFMFDEKKKKI